MKYATISLITTGPEHQVLEIYAIIVDTKALGTRDCYSASLRYDEIRGKPEYLAQISYQTLINVVFGDPPDQIWPQFDQFLSNIQVFVMTDHDYRFLERAGIHGRRVDLGSLYLTDGSFPNDLMVMGMADVKLSGRERCERMIQAVNKKIL